MKIAVCPGSFDPITMGHLDIIQRASKLFDKVIVLVTKNLEKKNFFSVQQRMDFIKRSTKTLDNIEVEYNDGLLADYISKVGADAIVKGLRAVSDFDYEFQMALANKTLNKNVETIFLTTCVENLYLSSSFVRQIGVLGGKIEGFVPKEIEDDIKKILIKGNKNENK